MDSDLKIIIYDGRREQELNGEENPWHYVDGQETTDDHIRGDYIWDQDNFTILFDVFTKDYGVDGIAGDAFIDEGGNATYEAGEPTLSFGGHLDYGLDGINFTFDEGEGDGVWQPGDAWIDTNGNQIVDSDDEFDSNYEFDASSDVWPPPHGEWDEGEYYEDWGQDGIAGNGDAGEGNGAIPIDADELDGNYDTGDACYGCDSSENELINRFQSISDTNGDLYNDYPDFEIDNRKTEARIDINGLPFWGLDDMDITFQSGYSWSKSQIVTGVGRYLLDGWEYTYNQLKMSYGII